MLRTKSSIVEPSGYRLLDLTTGKYIHICAHSIISDLITQSMLVWARAIEKSNPVFKMFVTEIGSTVYQIKLKLEFDVFRPTEV